MAATGLHPRRLGVDGLTCWLLGSYVIQSQRTRIELRVSDGRIWPQLGFTNGLGNRAH
jgi:hypothetical protein